MNWVITHLVPEIATDEATGFPSAQAMLMVEAAVLVLMIAVAAARHQFRSLLTGDGQFTWPASVIMLTSAFLVSFLGPWAAPMSGYGGITWHCSSYQLISFLPSEAPYWFAAVIFIVSFVDVVLAVPSVHRVSEITLAALIVSVPLSMTLLMIRFASTPQPRPGPIPTSIILPFAAYTLLAAALVGVGFFGLRDHHRRFALLRLIGAAAICCPTVFRFVTGSLAGDQLDRTVAGFWLLNAGALLMLIGALRGIRRRPPPTVGHCLVCDYNLTGNTTGRCPECGTRVPPPVDPPPIQPIFGHITPPFPESPHRQGPTL